MIQPDYTNNPVVNTVLHYVRIVWAYNTTPAVQQYRKGEKLGLQGKKFPYTLTKEAKDKGVTKEAFKKALANIGYDEDELYDMPKRMQVYPPVTAYFCSWFLRRTLISVRPLTPHLHIYTSTKHAEKA